MYKTCKGINYLNDCCYAIMNNGCFGCKYKGICEYQRPFNYENEELKKCKRIINNLWIYRKMFRDNKKELQDTIDELLASEEIIDNMKGYVYKIN